MRDGASLFSLSLVCCLEKTFYRFLLDPQDISSCPKLDVDPGIWSHGSTTWANYLTFLWLIIFIYKMEIRITLWKLNELLYIKGLLTVVPSTSRHYVISCYQYYINGIFPGLLFILCCLGLNTTMIGVSQVVLVVKNPPANAWDMRNAGSITGLGRSPEGRNSNPFQHCLWIPMDG